MYTTRPETVFGVKFVALSPFHPVLATLSLGVELNQKIQDMANDCSTQTGIQKKEGVDLGLNVIHPLTKEPVPVFVCNYVLQSYGTGAVMGVPAHDERDKEFADLSGISYLPVIDEETQTLINSGPYSSLSIEEGKKQIVEKAEQENVGSLTTQFRLRDWLVSRQRYWGAPIPIVYCSSCPDPVPVPEDQLPVLLPPLASACDHDHHKHEAINTDADDEEDGNLRPVSSSLADFTDWINTTCPSFVFFFFSFLFSFLFY